MDVKTVSEGLFLTFLIMSGFRLEAATIEIDGFTVSSDWVCYGSTQACVRPTKFASPTNAPIRVQENCAQFTKELENVLAQKLQSNGCGKEAFFKTVEVKYPGNGRHNYTHGVFYSHPRYQISMNDNREIQITTGPVLNESMRSDGTRILSPEIYQASCLKEIHKLRSELGSSFIAASCGEVKFLLSRGNFRLQSQMKIWAYKN